MNKPKFNLMDGFIIIVLLVVIALGTLVISRMGNSSTTGEVQNSVAVYQVHLTKYDKAVADAFVTACENGEVASVSEKESFAGKIVDVEISPTTKPVVNETNKTIVVAEDPTSYDIFVTLESSVLETDSSITASGNRLAVGEKVTIRGKSAAGIGYITDIAIKD